MASLTVDITLPRRGFDVAVAVDVSGVLALVGPSGAGKTSVLRAVAGLEQPSRGTIALDGEVWFAVGSVDRPPDRRPVGFVFQEYALFPHMTVAANVAFGAAIRADEIMERVGIGHLSHARPSELSGGERQRVAVARALARGPLVLLLDEPTAALDILTRQRVRVELVALIAETGVPTIVVTHDFEEAATLADTVGVLVEGQVRQLGRPTDLLDAPVDAFVAGLTGSNVLAGMATAEGGGITRVRLEGGAVIASPDRIVGCVAAVVHPRQIDVGNVATTDTARNRVQGLVTSLVPIGGGVRVCIGPLVAEVSVSAAAQASLAVGDVVTASFRVDSTRLVAREAALL